MTTPVGAIATMRPPRSRRVIISQGPPVIGVYDDSSPLYMLRVWEIGHIEEHLIVAKIRDAIEKYRLQSASHFDLQIHVHQTARCKYREKRKELGPSFKVELLFSGSGSLRLNLRLICRLQSDKDKNDCDVQQISVDLIEIHDSNKWMSLQEFLNKRFPAGDNSVDPNVMYDWWKENGKQFLWNKLPAEIMERVIQSCMHRKYQKHHYLYQNSSIHWQAPGGRFHPQGRYQGLFEVTNQLEGYRELLTVNRQVRAITLRLCFVGSSSADFEMGLSTNAKTSLEFRNTVLRLEQCYQMVEPNGVPVDVKTKALAEQYRRFPQRYPELKQYANYFHALRRVRLAFNHLDFLHFFKVTAGGFNRYWRNNFIDYSVFQRLPHLEELIFIVPLCTEMIRESLRQPGPLLFGNNEKDYCPRLICRFIYERAAEVLAPYENVYFYNLMDHNERARFYNLHAKAVKVLKVKQGVLKELYKSGRDGKYPVAEDAVQVPPLQVNPADLRERNMAKQKFWPPKCKCSTRCDDFIEELKKKRDEESREKMEKELAYQRVNS